MSENTVEIKEKEEKTPKTTKEKVFFVLKIIGNVVFYGIIILLFLFSIFNINGGNGTENFPNIFGTGYLSVQSDSMKRNDANRYLDEWEDYEIGGFEKGDLLKDSVFKEKNADVEHLKIGMVITFYDTTLKSLNTHRIVYVHSDYSGSVDYVITQGDARAQLQAYKLITEQMTEAEIAAAREYDYILESSGAIEVVEIANIKGIVKSVTPGGGKVFDNIRDNYLLYFVMPVAVLLIIEIFFVIRNIMILRGEKNKAELEGTREAMLADVEAEKEKMRQELLAEMRAQGLVAAEAPKAEEVKEENTEENAEVDTSKEEVEANDNEVKEVEVNSNEDSTLDADAASETNDEVKPEAVEEAPEENTDEPQKNE